MNKKYVFFLFGRIAQTIAALMLLPALVAVIYNEYKCLSAFLITAILSFLLGTVIAFSCRTDNRVIYAKEGFAIVAIAWIGLSAIGALPFVISGEIPSYVDALFETVSGFTTTGSTILRDVEVLSRSMLFWRSFTHWVGGMGVLVFVMAIVSNLSERSIHIMRAEMPGPVVGKIVPRVRNTAKILYFIYIVMTVIEITLLKLGGMPWFDSIVHTFGTAGTGGFGIKGDSIGGYSNFCQIVIAVAMICFGINFNLYYLLLIRRFKSITKSTELWAYLAIIIVSVSVITFNIYPIYNNAADSLRLSFFQVSSIITTTGFSTADFNLWPSLSKSIILLLTCFGGCAGSTAGGLKISRVVILFKLILKELRRMLHPRSVTSVEVDGKPVDNQTLGSVATYFAVYVLCVVIAFIAISFEPFGFETNLSATLATFNNVGPGFGAVGPMASFASYSDFSKIVFSAAMLLGRLEIFPLILALSPSVWMKKR